MKLLLGFVMFIVFFMCVNELSAQTDTFYCPTDQTVLQQVGDLVEVTYTLKVLLIEFDDVQHNTSAYTFTNFNNMFFSSGVYVSPNMYSPDGQQVFGSMRDYYSVMSDGDFTLSGYVVNLDENKDDIPDWLTLQHTKQYYDERSWSYFYTDAFAAANNAGLDITTGSTTKLAIIYAGHTYRGAGLNPRANGLGGTFYINGELFAPGTPYDEEREDAKFSHIGINVHEFGHLLGEYDLYSNGFFDAMNAGNYLGPNYSGACPASFNPQTRYKKGWISFDLINENHTYQSDYDLRDPEVFKIQKTSDPNYFWLIETRNYNSNITIGSTSCHDYNYYTFRSFFANPPDQGVLVWKVVNNGSATLLKADGKDWISYPWLSLGTPFPGSGNVKVLSPWSDSRTSPSWVPNTKPSTNVGMEIVGIGSGYYTIDLYVTNPEDASPSKPQNLTVEESANHHPRLDWTANSEPDLNYYKIYKKKYYNFAWHWDYLAQTENNYYEDQSETWCGNPPCINPNNIYYRVTSVDDDSKESVQSDSVQAVINGGAPDKISVNSPAGDKPSDYSLLQNYPNPFNPTTTISYSILKDGLATIKVYDVLGTEVAELVNDVKEAGNYSVTFNASELPSGIYFYKLTSGNFTATKKLILLK